MNKKKLLSTTLLFLSFYQLNAQTTIILQPDSTQGKDSKIWSNGVNNNYGNVESINAYTWTNSGARGIKRIFLEFDFSAIPANAVITSAKLSVFHNPNDLYDGAAHSGANDIYIERVTSSWNESTITWANQPSTIITNRVSLPPSTSSSQNYTNIDVTNLVVDMNNPSLGNYGFMIRMQDEINYYKKVVFASSDHPTAALRPKLEVTYTEEKTNCLLIKPDSLEGKDAKIWNNGINNNYGNAESLNAYTWTNGGSLGVKRIFVEFDFSGIPANAIITSADLSLFYNPTDQYDPTYHSGTNSIYIERVTSPWNENTITWANQPTTSPINRVSLPASTSQTQNYINMDVTSLVVNMNNSSIGNNGFMIKMQDEINYYQKVLFASSEHPIDSLHPEIEICWELDHNVSIDSENNDNLDFKVFPNPNAGTFELLLNKETKYELEIFDITGKKVNEFERTGSKITIHSNGVYIVKIYNQKGNYTTQKVIVNK